MRALVTGTSRGLGLAIARHLLDQGARVYGCARSEAAIAHPNYTHAQVDVTDETSVRDLMSTIRAQEKRLDVLINNAGTAKMLPALLTPLSTAHEVMDINFISTFLVTREAARLLRRSDAGRVVNFSSVAVPLGLEGESLYVAAKGAIEAFTRSVAGELGSMGITCNAVGPSPIRTALIRGVPEAKLQALIDRQSIPEWATEADVLNVVDFFLKPESHMVTGQVIYLGGIS